MPAATGRPDGGDARGTSQGRVWVRRLLPAGTPLPERDWQRRHAMINVMAVSHVPVVLLYAFLAGFRPVHAVLETLPVAALALVGRYAGTRRVRELGTTLSLVTSSAVLVHLSGGYIELHFHFFVIVALVTLYQQWWPFLAAILFVALHHGIAGAIAPTSVYNHPDAVAHPWAWAGVHAAFIAMASVVGIANWKLNELARDRAEDSFRRLYDGEAAVVHRLHEADRVKAELIAAVSHEFRTPLTAILGFSQTLGRLPQPATELVHDVAGRIESQSRRLAHLVENLMDAARVADHAPGSSEVGHVVDQSIAATVGDAIGRRSLVHVEVVPGLRLPLSEQAARLVVGNLLENALKFSSPGMPVTISARRDGARVVLDVANHGPEVPAALARRIFEPFVQGDSSDTRSVDGIGLGLDVVRRLVEANSGDVTVSSVEGVTTFRVRFPSPESPSPQWPASPVGAGSESPRSAASAGPAD